MKIDKMDIIKKRFFATAIGDVLKALDGYSLVGAVTLSLCIVDYIAYLGYGPSGNFKTIITKYLKKINVKYDADRIYALRCALIHCYSESERMKAIGLKQIVLTHLNHGYHLKRNNDGFVLNVDTFITDVIWSAWQFFRNHKNNVQKITDRARSMLRVTTISDSDANKPYENMHTKLKEFDRDRPNREQLRKDIRSILKNSTV